MARIYYDRSDRGLVILGVDPFSPAAQQLVAAMNNTPAPGVCACSAGEQCDLPHEDWNVLWNRNGHYPHPGYWVRGDCGAAYTGWMGAVQHVEVPDGASEKEIFLFVLRTVCAYEETRAAEATER